MRPKTQKSFCVHFVLRQGAGHQEEDEHRLPAKPGLTLFRVYIGLGFRVYSLGFRARV